MKFLIEYADFRESTRLLYNVEDFSFETQPSIHETNFDIVVNKINLSVDNNNRIIQLWGFCGYNEWIKSEYIVPKYNKGIIKIGDELAAGFSYSLPEKDLKVFVNVETGWLCIGNPERFGKAVEFLNYCVMTIDDNNEFLALWLKPEKYLI